MRILILNNIVNPHMTPVFEAMSRTPGVELSAAFFAEREVDRTWNAGSAATFQSTILKGRQITLPLRWDTISVHVNPGLSRFLRELRPDVVINGGWTSVTNWHAFVDCRRMGIRHVLWAGSTRNERSWLRTITRPAVKLLVRKSDAVAAHGTASAQYLEDLGAASDRLVRAFHCIDNARFLSQCERTRPQVPAERHRLGLTNRKVVLFVGRMVGCKGVGYLIEAMGQLARERDDVTLLLAGDGPMRSAWQRQAEQSLPPGTVHFLGNKPLEELPLYYQLADVFVLPSVEEIWGLVVNEAALAGLPLVVSEACGAAADLVEPGVNGFRVPAASADALFAAIQDVLRDDDTRQRMGQESRRIVELCTPERAAAALVRAAELAMGVGCGIAHDRNPGAD